MYQSGSHLDTCFAGTHREHPRTIITVQGDTHCRQHFSSPRSRLLRSDFFSFEAAPCRSIFQVEILVPLYMTKQTHASRDTLLQESYCAFPFRQSRSHASCFHAFPLSLALSKTDLCAVLTFFLVLPNPSRFCFPSRGGCLPAHLYPPHQASVVSPPPWHSFWLLGPRIFKSIRLHP